MARLSTQLLLPSLTLLATSRAYSQDALRYRFQYYDEEGGRIDVESHYLDLKYGVGASTTLGLRFAIDSLSGMTPVGTHADGNPDDWNFQEIDDERIVSIFTIDHEINDHTLSFEYARSEEEDYLSNAIALKLRSELFEKNTTLTAGVAVGLDKVISTPFTNILEDRTKDTFDFTLGVSQLMGPRTILDLTLGYGHSEGFLADPYRRISQIIDFGGFTDTFEFSENRPREQDRWVAKIAGRHYFPELDAALSGSYRFFSNSDNVEGHTLEVKWIQQVTQQFSVTPYFRYYQQSAANFYTPSLTGAGFIGHDRTDGRGPFYSSDYRLSAFEAMTYGLRLTYEATNDLTFELQFERYEMSGLDSRTPNEFFPSANVTSIGAQWKF